MSDIESPDASPSVEAPASPISEEAPPSPIMYTPPPYIALDPPVKRARSVRSSREQPVAIEQDDDYSDVEVKEDDDYSDVEVQSPPPRRPLPALPTSATTAAKPEPDYNEACQYNRVQQFLCSENVPESMKEAARSMLERMAEVLDVSGAREMIDPRLCTQVGQTIEKCHTIQRMRECMVKLAGTRQKLDMYSEAIRAKIEPDLSAAEERVSVLYQDMVKRARDPNVEAEDYAASLQECSKTAESLDAAINTASRASRRIQPLDEEDEEIIPVLSRNSWWESLLDALGLQR